MAVDYTFHNDINNDALKVQSMTQGSMKPRDMNYRRLSKSMGKLVRISHLSSDSQSGPRHHHHPHVKYMQQKLRKVEVENERLRSQLATSNLRKVAMKERVKEVECQTEKLRQRVEDAEKLLTGLPVESFHHQESSGLEIVCHRDKNYDDDDDVNLLQGVLENSDNFDQKMSTNYFDVIIGMDHQEQTEIQSYGETKLLCWDNNQQVEYHVDDIEQVQELQEEVKMLTTKLKFSATQRQAMKEIIIALDAKLTQITGENESLKKEVYEKTRLLQARKDDIFNLEHCVESLSVSNQMLKSMLNLKKMAMETRKSESLLTLEPILVKLAGQVSLQNACVVRLSVQNEALARSLQVKTLENEHQIDQVSTIVKQKEAAVRALEHFKEQVVEWATEMDEQSSNYEMMREYTLNLEADLKHYQSQFANLVETYNEVLKEREQLLAWQAHARSQIAEYEKSILEREKESESISQHAMYMSLEVELLRRKLQELDEDVMVKEGQISILQSTWESD